MTDREVYYIASGIAYQKGVDDFEHHLTREEAADLMCAMRETKGFRWFNTHIVDQLVSIAGRRMREAEKPPCPPDPCRCTWRKRGTDLLDLQRNALRVEIMQPEDRCGYLLKADRIGGDFFDYLPCRKPVRLGA